MNITRVIIICCVHIIYLYSRKAYKPDFQYNVIIEESSSGDTFIYPSVKILNIIHPNIIVQMYAKWHIHIIQFILWINAIILDKFRYHSDYPSQIFGRLFDICCALEVAGSDGTNLLGIVWYMLRFGNSCVLKV